MTQKAKHLQALPSDIANYIEVRQLFGENTIQASVTETTSVRNVYQLVGLNHSVIQWLTPMESPLPECPEGWEREYDPAEIPDSEKWIVNIFEPIRDAFYNDPRDPYVFVMPDFLLSPLAELAMLICHAKGKLVYIFRRLKVVHVYDIVIHGREYWYSLNLSTDHRYVLTLYANFPQSCL